MFILKKTLFDNICCCSDAKSCLTLRPHELQLTSFPILHYLPEFAQTHSASTYNKNSQQSISKKRTKKNLLQTSYLVVKLLMLSITLWSYAVQFKTKKKGHKV